MSTALSSTRVGAWGGGVEAVPVASSIKHGHPTSLQRISNFTWPVSLRCASDLSVWSWGRAQGNVQEVIG